MEKTELMIEYEIKIDSVVNWGANPIGYTKYLESELIKERAKPTITYKAVETFQEIIRNQCDEITALKEKAEAYDRLMSGGKKTLKEWANMFGKPVVINACRIVFIYENVPRICCGVWCGQFVCSLSRDLSDFNGDWKDSLTLPDGWRER